MHPKKIDLVYTWVNGNDPAWQEKEAAYKITGLNPSALSKGRLFDNDELRFSLRSVEKYAPWINHIYIVTDHQAPIWLNTAHEKITLVDHEEIIDSRYLPVFNPGVFEWSLHKIKGLSEYYLYANDDMFFGSEAKPSDFFDENGLPIEYVMKYVPPNHSLSGRRQQNTNQCFFNKTGQMPVYESGHVIDPYRKSFVEEICETFRPEIEQIYQNRFRQENDLRRFIIGAYDHYLGRR
jgi:hypothetical protein